ncbi:alpha/beta fold hydrolase [Candidatus Uabimicrobium sp. HlEnr_7]|uniref:alpha/beta fold hydrolase n=1 Tax=Candidatus Uabimicrobium helgolandensis TaxID=3095367 RepID=UPI0035583483
MLNYLADSVLCGFKKCQLSDSTKFISTISGKIRVYDTESPKKVIIIVPDGPCVVEHYFELIELLKPYFRVVCFDMPGFGFSYPSWKYNFSFAKTTKVLASLFDALRIEKASLAFSCANGFFAMDFAEKYPKKVSHLILSQTPSLSAMGHWTQRIIPRSIQTPIVGQMILAAKTKKIAQRWFDIALPRENVDKAFFVDRANKAFTKGACFCLASIVQGLNKEKGNIFNIEIPSIAFYGTKDFSHKHTDFTSIRQHIPSCELISVECGHFPDLEKPDFFGEHILEFVNKSGI